MVYVRYVNSRYEDLTKGEVYEVLEDYNGSSDIRIKNNYGYIISYPWFYICKMKVRNEVNFIHIPIEEHRNEVINEILGL